MRGAIDSLICLEAGRFVIGGWCRFDEGLGSATPVRLFLSDGTEVPYHVVSRADLGGDYGFSFELSDSDLIMRIFLGATELRAVSGEQGGVLGIWQGARDAFRAAIALSHMDAVPATRVSGLIAKLSARVSAPDVGADVRSETSSIPFPVGSVSHDGTAVVGREGMLFLFRGSNRVHDSYLGPARQVEVDGWRSVLARRREICDLHGAEYRQLVVPEKQSVLRLLYPFEVPDSTPLLEAVSSIANGHEFWLDCVTPMRKSQSDGRGFAFRRLDTHPSLIGTISLVRALLTSLRLDVSVGDYTVGEAMLQGDLISKFAAGSGLERVEVPVWSPDSAMAYSPACLGRFDPPSGHMGIRRTWEQSAAPVRKRVVVFGNSVCERGESPLGLSWWFARLFERCVFVWSPAFDPEVVEREKPDLVVCQTVERFLGTVPKA